MMYTECRLQIKDYTTSQVLKTAVSMAISTHSKVGQWQLVATLMHVIRILYSCWGLSSVSVSNHCVTVSFSTGLSLIVG